MGEQATSPEQVDPVRKVELDILEAAKLLMEYEAGALFYGLGKLSVCRASSAPDDFIARITNGARQLAELEKQTIPAPSETAVLK